MFLLITVKYLLRCDLLKAFLSVAISEGKFFVFNLHYTLLFSFPWKTHIFLSVKSRLYNFFACSVQYE
jgi:hypothetical protein